MNQENRRRELYALLGDLPDRTRPVSAQTISETQADGYTVERLVLDLNGLEPVPAVFVRPTGHAGPFPCVLYHHAHGANYGLGKEELLQGGRSSCKREASTVQARGIHRSGGGRGTRGRSVAGIVSLHGASPWHPTRRTETFGYS
jgi:hypothetical protein